MTLLAVALDVDSVDDAVAISKQVADPFDVAKVGLQMVSANGPAVVEQIAETGLDVFLDVKLHDIPNTVEKAAKALGRLGVRYLTVHAAGGVDMMRAAVDGLGEGASMAGVDAPTVLAVTVLTSLGEASPEVLTERTQYAIKAGAGGIVCAVPDLATTTAVDGSEELTICTPGIRFADGDKGDQKRVATPSIAVEMGATMLVVGRAVTASDDTAAAAQRVRQEVNR